MVLETFKQDKRLDPVCCVKEYINRTKDIRSSDWLFVSVNKPHAEVKQSTIAEWIAKVICHSGQRGTGGSVRSMSSTRAASGGASLEAVLAAGDWSRCETFKKFYYKPGPMSFVEAVLSK